MACIAEKLIPCARTGSGDITIGSGTVVHPRATIHSLGSGEIVIGSECIIEEFAQIIYRGRGRMVIGDRNLFEAGCRECYLS